jgi:hypothetical protein
MLLQAKRWHFERRPFDFVWKLIVDEYHSKLYYALHLYGCTTVINIAVLNIINDLGKVNRTLPVLYTLAGKCILKAPKRASYYYGVLNTVGNVLFYIVVICQPAKYKQGKDSQAKVLYSIP